MVTVTLDCAALAWATRHIQTESDWAQWGRSFVEALATSTTGLNAFADKLISDVHAYRASKAEEMRNLRENRHVTNVPEQIEVTEHSPTSSLVSSSFNSSEKNQKIKEEFDEARKAYPGTKRGLDPEWENFRKKHGKQAAEIVPLLLPAIREASVYRKDCEKLKAFCPAWKNFQTWINGSHWLDEFPDYIEVGNGR